MVVPTDCKLKLFKGKFKNFIKLCAKLFYFVSAFHYKPLIVSFELKCV